MELELEDQFLGSSPLPEPSQDRQGGISGNVEQGHLALAQAQPFARTAPGGNQIGPIPPDLPSQLSSNPLGLTSWTYHGKMRRSDIVEIYVL